MPLPVSVIVAALDEEALIGQCVAAAYAAGAAEVIVCDGGSRDATPARAASAGARVIACEPMRSKQLNRGAREAAHQCLIFVHGDTRLPAGAAEAVANALEISAFGAFRIAFAEADAKLRLAATMINLRSSITGCPWGDQAQFIRRDTFLDSGGFREIPLMEDYELALRMRRRGRTTVLALKVTTSGRRFLRRGVLRTAFTNWQIIVRYRLGADPQELAKIYLR